jgi:hypothetical protein
MRVGLVRNVGLSITALAVLALGGCDDNPLSFDVKDTVGIQVNPSEMVVSAGRTAELESRAVNQGNEPTFDAVTAAVDPICGQGSIQIIDLPELEIEPPGLFAITGGSVLGQTCIVLTSGSNTAQVDVTVVADGAEITAPEDGQVFRSGDTGQIIAQLIGLDGTPVGPYAPEDAVFSSSESGVAEITDEVGNFSTTDAGSTTLSVTWAGQALNGTSGLGVVVDDEVGIEVIANVPESAAFTAGANLGVLPADVVVEFDIFVADAAGNRNTIPDEIISIAATSSDPAVVSIVPSIETDGSFGLGDIPVVEVTTVAAGAVTITGTVTTSEGDLPFVGALLVPNPIITAVTPATGAYAETVTITGTDFADISKVYVGGYLLGNFTIDSPTQITAQMPTYSTLPGPLDVVVSVAGIESPAGPTWEQTLSFEEGATEDNSPFISGNDAPISVPAFIAGSLIGEPVDPVVNDKMADWLFFTISGDTERTIDITQTLIGTEDMEFWVVDGGLNFFWCHIDDFGPGGAESGECDLPAAGEELDTGVPSVGTWWVIPQEWGNVDTNYIVSITMVDE